MISTISVLVVDDEEGIRKSLKEYLELEGYDIDTAKDGEEAVEMARNKRYSVVLMDINMPGIDGLEAMRSIRKIDFSTQVIIMTAYSTFEKTVKSLEYGAADYILKPFGSLADLLKLIEMAEERLVRWRKNMAGSIIKKR